MVNQSFAQILWWDLVRWNHNVKWKTYTQNRHMFNVQMHMVLLAVDCSREDSAIRQHCTSAVFYKYEELLHQTMEGGLWSMVHNGHWLSRITNSSQFWFETFVFDTSLCPGRPGSVCFRGTTEKGKLENEKALSNHLDIGGWNNSKHCTNIKTSTTTYLKPASMEAVVHGWP